MQQFDSFDVFVRLQSRQLLRSAWMLTGDWVSAEDLVQAGLLIGWQNWAKIEAMDLPGLYIRQLVVRLYLQQNRSRRLREVLAPEVPDRTTEGTSEGDVLSRQLLLSCLRLLTPRQRAVVALRYLEDWPDENIAKVLGCSTNTIKAHNHRALLRLRKMLELKDLPERRNL